MAAIQSPWEAQGEFRNNVPALSPARAATDVNYRRHGYKPVTGTMVHSCLTGIRVTRPMGDDSRLSRGPSALSARPGFVSTIEQGLARCGWGSADSPLGATITAFDPATAAQVLGTPGKVSQINVEAAAGVSQSELGESAPVSHP